MEIEQATKLMSKLLETGEAIADFPEISGYRIFREIGQGGSGKVYEGVVNATGRSVAIKIYHTRVTNPTSHSIHELELLTHVRSPVVPHVLDHGWINDQVYIVTEFIDGPRLLEYAENLKQDDRVRLLVDICDAVTVLNERGIIHRDIKPSNILITKRGTPVLIDLGIAELIDSEEKHTSIFQRVSDPTGTLDFMCPEQARGENDAVTIRWDVYGLGAVAYVLLLGSTPRLMHGSTQERLERLSNHPARDPREIDHKLPKQLAAVLQKACSFDPTNRYESAQHFREDLHRWLSGNPVRAGKQSLWNRAVMTIAKHPYICVSLISIVIASSIFSVSALIFWYQSMLPYRFAPQEQRETNLAELVSRSGLSLRVWQTDNANGIRYGGDLFETQQGHFAVIGLEVPDIRSGDLGLIGYNLRAYDEPAWIATQIIPEALKYTIRNEPGPHSFRFRRILVEDIFPERTGREIVSVHYHSLYSLSAIQIHTPSGELLCDYYHDGWPTSLYWNPVYEQLVLLGQNSDGTSLDRGADTMWVGKYPVVAFAIEPQIGQFNQAIQHPGLELGDLGYQPAWYKCLLPGDGYTHIQSSVGNAVEIGLHAPGLETERQAGYTAIQLGGMANHMYDHVTLLVDHHGNVQSRVVTDSWDSTNGFDPYSYNLEDLPSRITKRKYWPD